MKKDLGGFTVQLKTEKEENKAGEEENFLAIEVYSNDGTVTYEVPKNGRWQMMQQLMQNWIWKNSGIRSYKL